LIIKAGENISPRVIEEVLFKHPKVSEAAVIGMPRLNARRKEVKLIKAILVFKYGLFIADSFEVCLSTPNRWVNPRGRVRQSRLLARACLEGNAKQAYPTPICCRGTSF
jgi:acyl-CoA synthetase (AMP-forming)/AMP-acid ligase II